jgi:hypothetical protein
VGNWVDCIEMLMIKLMRCGRAGNTRIKVNYVIERLAWRAKRYSCVTRVGRKPKAIQECRPERILKGAVEKGGQQLRERLRGQHVSSPSSQMGVSSLPSFYDKLPRSHKRLKRGASAIHPESLDGVFDKLSAARRAGAVRW